MRFISDKIVSLLISEIEVLIDRYAPCEYDTDYECAFCGARHDVTTCLIPHKVDCAGLQILDALRNSDDLLFATIGVKENKDV